MRFAPYFCPVSGPSGVSGVSGVGGSSGVSGVSGASGPPGEIGASGTIVVEEVVLDGSEDQLTFTFGAGAEALSLFGNVIRTMAGGTVSINVVQPASGNVKLTIPDTGGDATFLFSNPNQTIQAAEIDLPADGVINVDNQTFLSAYDGSGTATNVFLGSEAGNSSGSGANNVVLGYQAGKNYTGAESNNVLLSNSGTVGDSGVIRLGTIGTQSKAYVAGVAGETVSNQVMVTMDSTDGQMGTTTIVPVTNGGTGASGFTNHAVILGTGVGNPLSNTMVGTDGQVLIGATNADPQFASITSSTGTISITQGPNALNVDVNANIISKINADTGSVVPSSSAVSVVGGSGTIVKTTGSGSTLSIGLTNGTNGQVLLGGGSQAAWNSLTSTNGSLTYTTGANTLNIDTTLPVTSLNTVSSIVSRDSGGNFSAGTITASLMGAATDNVLKAGDTMTGALTVPAGSAANPSLTFTGSSTTGLASVSNMLLLATNGVERLRVHANGTVQVANLNTAGVVHSDGSGNLSTSSIVNADISSSAAIVDTKLAVISTAGKVANSATTATSNNTVSTIVARDGSGSFSAGTITATLTGTASGNVAKSGDTMTGALTVPEGTTSMPSLNFTGSVTTGLSSPSPHTLSISTNGSEAVSINSSGDVTINGLASAGVVHTDGTGKLLTSSIVNADITNNTITNAKLATIASTDTAGAIVVRDGSGTFATTMITLNGTPTVGTDAATKSYVDSVAASGLDPHPAARVVSTSNVSLTGLQTIDGVVLVDADRVLLVGQTNAVENGLWVAHSGAWTRPTDFSTGSTAGSALVLITSGATQQGSSWICETPSAVIDTNPITFAQFSLPNQITGANVGSGTGQVFRDVTGTTMNLRTLLQGTHVNITTNTNDITIDTNGTSSNTASTLVARNGSGNFSAGTITANLTGNASGNVLKTGDSMTGNLTLLTGNALRLQDTAGSNFVGLAAPATVGASYTVLFPSSAPVSTQTLVATSATDLTWQTVGGSVVPSSARLIYVTKFGNDTTGTGSLTTPYASLSKAISVANGLSSSASPVSIMIYSGLYFENNSAGPITISADGISVIGLSSAAVTFVPTTLSNNLLLVTKTVQFLNLSFLATGGTSTATAITFTSGSFTLLHNCRALNFQTGFLFQGTTSNSYVVSQCLFSGNGTAISVDTTLVQLNACVVVGSAIASTPANTGATITGTSAHLVLVGGTYVNCASALSAQNSAVIDANAVSIQNNAVGLALSLSGQALCIGCSFLISPDDNAIAVSVSDSGSNAQLNGCELNALGKLAIPLGTGLYVTNGGLINASNCSIHYYTTALKVGTVSDLSDTVMETSSNGLFHNTTDILQQGSSTLIFASGLLDETKLTVNDPTNVSMSYFNANANYALDVGKGNANVDFTALIINNGNGSNNPTLGYIASLYGDGGFGLQNPSGRSNLYTLSKTSQRACLTAIVTDRTQNAQVRLVSDTGSPVGTTTALRGWDMVRNGATSNTELQFAYQNSDTSGQVAVPYYVVFKLDGVANTVSLADTGTKLMWSTDTNLYRAAAGSLKTDGNLTVSGLTASRALATDANKQLVSSATTSTELGFVSGVTSAIQTQLNNKMSISGGTFTGAVTFIAGSPSVPSIQFTGSSTGTGIYAGVTNTISMTTAGVERWNVDPSGHVTVLTGNFTTANGSITSATHLQSVAGNVILPATTSSVGQLVIESKPFVHQGFTNSNSTFLGSLAGSFTGTGTKNTAVGSSALTGLTSGASNLALGASAGSSLSGTDSSNVCVMHAGVAGVSNTTYLGTFGTGTGQQNKCFIAGATSINNSLNLNSTIYNTGTASQSTTTITGSGTTFTSSMVGGVLIFADGTEAYITRFNSTTSLTSSVSQTVTSQSFTLYYGTTQMDNTGRIGAQGLTVLGTTGNSINFGQATASVSFNVAAANSVTCNGSSGKIAVTLATTNLSANRTSAVLTINNSSVSSSSIVLCTIANNSNLTGAANTAVAALTVTSSAVSNGSFGVQFTTNATATNAGTTFSLNFLVV